MKLDDFLKVKQVRCISEDCSNLTAGKTYEVLGVTRNVIKIVDDENEEWWSSISCFELVSDPAEKPPQVAEPKFAAGEKVYFSTNPDIKIVSDVNNDNTVRFFGEFGWADSNHCCPATQENYERLQATFTEIEFEQPPKPLTGSDLCRAMVDKGWFIVDCYVSPISDEHALRVKAKRMQVTLFVDDLFTDGALRFRFAVPIDPRTGEPLTEAVLDE